MDSNRALQSVEVLSGSFTLSGAPPALAVAALVDGAPTPAPGIVPRLRRAAAALDPIDFVVGYTVTTSEVSIDYAIQSASDGGSIHLHSTGPNADDLTTTLTLSDGTNTTGVQVTQTGTALDGTISYDGTVVVTISGTTAQATFATPSGTPLTDAQVAALRAIGNFIGNVFNAFNILLAPAFFAYHLRVA